MHSPAGSPGSSLGTEVRATLRLGYALVLAQLAQMSMALVDTLMVGRLGTVELASVGLGAAVFYPVTIVGLGILMAVNPMVSQAFGAGDKTLAGRSVRQGLWLAALLSIPAVLAMRNASVILELMGQSADVVVGTDGYLKAISWGVPGLFLFGVLRQFVEGVSRPRIIMVITVSGVGLNIFANYTLMFGRFGFPALGLVGTGWASAVVYWSMAVALAVFIANFEDFRPYGVYSRLGTPDFHVFAEIIRVGWPIGLMLLMEAGLFSGSGMMMGLIGTAELAAHQVALNSAAYVFMIPLGLSFAVAVRVGQAVGRKDEAAARRAGFVGIAIGGASMSVSALCFWLIPEQIMGLFLDARDPANQEVLKQGARLLGIAAIFQLCDGIQVSAAGALRGLKMTRVSMRVAFVSYWIVGFPLAWFLAFPMGWGGPGLWWGMVLGLTTAAVLLSWRFAREVGKRVPVRGAAGAP